MSRNGFYTQVTHSLFHGSLPAWQKNPLDAILDECERLGRDIRECAYVMATAYHETSRFKYNEEIGQGRGHKYGEEIWRYSNAKVAFFGRGWPQHTWLGNYARLSVRATLALGREIDFVNNPDLINGSDELQAWAMWECMISGLWTGRNFADCKENGVLDYVKARTIVNGTDRAELIAGYAEEFEAALALITDDPATSNCPLGRADCPGVTK